MAICDCLMGYLCPTRSTISDQQKNNNDRKISRMHKENLNSWSAKVGNYIGSFLKTCRIDFFFFFFYWTMVLTYFSQHFVDRSWLKWCYDQVWLVIEVMFRYIIKWYSLGMRKTAIYIYERVVNERVWWHNKLAVIVGCEEVSIGSNLSEKVGLNWLCFWDEEDIDWV